MRVRVMLNVFRFQVKTLKPLSTLKLQQLISLMEEESFMDEQYIASEGEMGDKFFIIVHGKVRRHVGKQTNKHDVVICISLVVSLSVVGDDVVGRKAQFGGSGAKTTMKLCRAL